MTDAAGAVRRTPRPALDDSCRAYDVDGETVRVQGSKPLDEAGQAALGEIVRAATAKLAAEHPNLGVTQELIMAGLAATRAIPNGQVRGGCTIQDGTKVKARLKAAIAAARDALSTERRPVVLLRAEDCSCTPPYADCPHGPEPVDALDLAVWLHAERSWQLDELQLDVEKYRDYLKMANRTTERRGQERDALQARLDGGLALIAKALESGPFLDPDETRALRAALQGDQPTEPDVIEVHGQLVDGRRIVGTVDLRPGRELADRLAAEANPPGGFPYRQHPHPLCGSNVERQQVGDPGHCEDCCSVGHVVAHPDLGCGDVGCDRTHGDEPTGEVDRG